MAKNVAAKKTSVSDTPKKRERRKPAKGDGVTILETTGIEEEESDEPGVFATLVSRCSDALRFCTYGWIVNGWTRAKGSVQASDFAKKNIAKGQKAAEIAPAVVGRLLGTAFWVSVGFTAYSLEAMFGLAVTAVVAVYFLAVKPIITYCRRPVGGDAATGEAAA